MRIGQLHNWPYFTIRSAFWPNSSTFFDTYFGLSDPTVALTVDYSSLFIPLITGGGVTKQIRKYEHLQSLQFRDLSFH